MSGPPPGPRPTFADGFGTRSLIADKHGEPLEQLRLDPEFVATPAFEFALRDRVGRLANFRHAYYARVRRVDRLEGGATLGIVSYHADGARLSRVLCVAEKHRLDLDINAALCLIRQLVPAVAMLHQNARDVAHGALAPERIVVTPHARVVITEYVLGSAVEQLRLSRERLWRDLRIAVPQGAGSPKLDHRTDVMQLGVIALSLVLGRQLRPEELRLLPELVAAATETTVLGRREPIAPPLRRWLMRALQLEPRGSFASAGEAHQALEDVLSEDGGYIAAPVALETFLARYQQHANREDDVPAAQLAPDSAHRDVMRLQPDSPGVRGIRLQPDSRDTRGIPLQPDSIHAPDTTRRTDSGSLHTRAVEASRHHPETGSPPPSPSEPGCSDAAAPAEPPSTPAPASLHEFLDELEAGDPPGEAAADAHAGRLTRWRRAGSRLGAMASEAGRRWERPALVICVAVVLLQAGFIWWKHLRGASLLPITTGSVAIESRPVGVPVIIDGKARGVTPLTVALAAGPHVLELGGGTRTRVLPISVKAGMTYTQYVELQDVQLTGAVAVTGAAPGSRVLVDGQLRGTTPLTVTDLSDGEHEISVEGPAGILRQVVHVQPGVTTTVWASRAAPTDPVADGWVYVEAPFEMQVREQGQTLGTTGMRLRLSPGRHELDVVSETLAFTTRRGVDVVAGRVTRLPIALPNGTVSIAADPWAEVWIEGRKVGTTPIGDLALPLGPYEIVLKHPELGEQRHAVSVTAAAPVSVSVKMQ